MLPVREAASDGTFTAFTSITPLPSTWLMMLGGFGAMGLFGWRRKWKNNAALLAAALSTKQSDF